MKITESQAIYLAGLLHDIGKFGQRAFPGGDKGLSASVRKMESNLCPDRGGYFSHRHVLWTQEFFTKIERVLPDSIENIDTSLGHLSARHHKPESEITSKERIIQFADKLSSAHDRRASTEEKQAEVEKRDFDRFRRTRLACVFDELFKQSNTEGKAYYPMHPLDLTSSSFASNLLSREDEEVKEQYSKMWPAFLEEVDRLPAKDFDGYATGLLYLLRKYTWCIPSSTIDQPDVSLFDHLKTTAVIASALHESEKVHGTLPYSYDGLKEEKTERFELIGADFSGIQKFIYTISSKAAAKTLKGRSFYLQLLADSIVQRVLDIYQAQEGHVLFSSGGRFYILVQNDPELRKKIYELADEINQRLQLEFEGTLYLGMACHSFRSAELIKPDGYGALVEELQLKLEADKSHKYARLMQSNLDFFEPEPLKGLTADDVCTITGADLFTDQPEFDYGQRASEYQIKISGWDEEGAISAGAAEQIILGKEIRNANWLLRYPVEGDAGNDAKRFHPCKLGYAYKVFAKDTLTNDDVRNADRVWAINRLPDYMEGIPQGCLAAPGFKFYGSAWTAKAEKTEEHEKGGVKEFTDLAEDGVNNLLGILRMDVDNLGLAFKEGFGKQADSNGSISRITTLSNQLDWFFSGYMHTFITNELTVTGTLTSNTKDSGIQAPKEFLYPVYAGGDDVFVAGRWDVLLQFAINLRKTFALFVNKHPVLTISGGIEMMQPKMPIHKGADAAGEAEHRAKAFGKQFDEGNPIPRKNSFALFDDVFDWADIFTLQNIVEEMVELTHQIEAKTLVSFLRRLTFGYLEAKEIQKRFPDRANDPVYGSWRWRAAYSLKRIAKDHQKFEKELVNIGAAMVLGGFENGKTDSAWKKPIRSKNSVSDTIEFVPVTTKWVSLLTKKQ